MMVDFFVQIVVWFGKLTCTDVKQKRLNTCDLSSWHYGTTVEPEESSPSQKKKKLKTWEENEMFIKHSGTYSFIKKEAESFRLFPKGRFMILNSAGMLPLWELKTFIKIRIFFLVQFQNQKRTSVSKQVGT